LIFKKGNKVQFTIISNEIIRDNRLSLDAKGLYACIQCSENFNEKDYKDSHETFEKALKELIKYGYLEGGEKI
jgi:hypothetical protein